MYSIRLKVRYHHRAIPLGALVLVLAVGALVMLTLNRAHATMPSSLSSPSTPYSMRQFYLSIASVSGEQAAAICAEGYHFASMWEIADHSNLKYNTSLGKTSPDSGAGPPTQIGRLFWIPARGWVRTGYFSSTSVTAGRGNCSAWSSDNGAHSGTVAHLVSDWTGDTQDVGTWNAEVMTCDTSVPVWCVQDHGLIRVFLPMVVKE